MLALGYYPVVEGNPLDRVFFDPPVEYQILEDDGVCVTTLTKPVVDIEGVRDRAIEFVWKIGKEECFRALSDRVITIETILFDILAYPELSGCEGGMQKRVKHWRELLERVKSAESIDEIREILTEDELLNIPA